MIDFDKIKELCKQGKIKWSNHASIKMQQRGIATDDVINCIMYGEIIEEYPDYWLNPACLIYGHSCGNVVLHVVVGLDDKVHIVTAYFPDTEKFLEDLKTRRERK